LGWVTTVRRRWRGRIIAAGRRRRSGPGADARRTWSHEPDYGPGVAGPTDPGSSELERILEDRTRTVTGLLEALTGEPVFADVISRRTVRAGADNALDVAPGHALAQRTAVLRGDNSWRGYLYAESLYVPERLSAEALARLEATSEPIGSVLADQGIRWAREPLPDPGPVGDPASDSGPEARQVVLGRAYRLLVDDLPAFAIREWFLRPVIDAMRHTV
jgi:chorismate-pyruvate lyase